MTIEIRMNYHINGNERVCIAGTIFNTWEPHEMKPVEGCGENGWWCAKLDLPEACFNHNVAEMEYKFVVLREGGANRWEECGNRVVTVEMPSKNCSLSFTDFWAFPLESKLEVSNEDGSKCDDVIVHFEEKKSNEMTTEEKKSESMVEMKPEIVIEKKEKKVEQKVEKKPEPVVEKKVEKKPEPVVEKKVEKKPEPVVEKKVEPVVEKKVEPVVEKKVEPVVEKKVEPASKAEFEKPEPVDKSKKQRKGQQRGPDEEPKKETVVLRHVEPKAEPVKQQSKHKKSGSIVEDCKKVFEPEGTPVSVPLFLRNSMKGNSSSAQRLAKYK